MIRASEPIFAVADITRSVRFYVDVLGFSGEWLWGNPPEHAGVRIDRHQVMFSLNPQLAQRCTGQQHFFRCDDVQAMHERHLAAGAQLVSPIENKPWGLREYTVRDPDGYHLRFAGELKYERPATATASMPPHISIELGLPDLATYVSLCESVKWGVHEPSMRQALQASQFGVLARDTRDGQTIGMIRVTSDARQAMIWDVIVNPSHQGQKIGSAMMEMAVSELRRTARSGTFVGLFTGKPGFYERVGFASGGGMCLIL